MKICIFGKEQRDKVWVSVKFYTEKIMCLTFMPVSTGINAGDCRDNRIVTVNPRPDNNPAGIKVVSTEIVNYLNLAFFNPVNTSDTLYKKFSLFDNSDGFDELVRSDLGVKMISMDGIITFNNSVLPWLFFNFCFFSLFFLNFFAWIFDCGRFRFS